MIQKQKLTTRSNEDYLEAILTLESTQSKIKSVKVAQLLGVSKPAVSFAMNELSLQGLIDKQSYGDICLTEKGREIAIMVKEKHNLIKCFLLHIGVSPQTAEIECCKLEHILCDETLSCIKKITNKN